jgi:hypothetical protein
VVVDDAVLALLAASPGLVLVTNSVKRANDPFIHMISSSTSTVHQHISKKNQSTQNSHRWSRLVRPVKGEADPSELTLIQFDISLHAQDADG